MNQELVEDLQDVMKVIRNPYRWSNRGDAFTIPVYRLSGKNKPSNTLFNFMTNGADPRAVCWCLTGALEKVTAEKTRDNGSRYENALTFLASLTSPQLRRKVVPIDNEVVVQLFNDTHSHLEVMNFVLLGVQKLKAA